MMEVLKVFRKQPDLFKVIFAGALASAGLSGTTLVAPVVRAQFWGQNMAENTSLCEGFRALLMVLFTPIFGRWTDTVPRKWALMVFGLVQWLPVWPFLLLGDTETAVWVGAGARVLSGVCGSSACAYALINDLTTPEERGVVFAAGAAMVTLLSWVPRTCVAIVAESFKGWLMAPCVCDAISLLAFLAVVASIKGTRREAAAEEPPKSASEVDKVGRQISECSTEIPMSTVSTDVSLYPDTATMSDVADLEAGATPRDDLEAVATPQGLQEGTDIRPAEQAPKSAGEAGEGRAPGWCAVLNVAGTARLVYETPNLLSLCAISVLISLPEIAEQAVTPQLVFQAFGAMGSPGMIEDITLVSTYTSMASAVVFFCLAGWLGERIGLARFIRVLIPLTSAAQLFVLLLLASPTLWCVALVSALGPIGMVVEVPLNALVSLAVPPACVGEALSAVTTFKAMAPLLGNFAVVPAIPLVGASHLWVFYIAGALMILLALPIAWGLRCEEAARHETEGKGEMHEEKREAPANAGDSLA